MNGDHGKLMDKINDMEKNILKEISNMKVCTQGIKKDTEFTKEKLNEHIQWNNDNHTKIDKKLSLHDKYIYMGIGGLTLLIIALQIVKG